MSGSTRFILSLVGASAGGLLVLAGLVVFVGQISYWMDSARWVDYSLMDMVKSPAVKSYLPKGFLSWLFRPESLYGLHEAVAWTLQTIPSSLCFVTLGALLLWRSIKW